MPKMGGKYLTGTTNIIINFNNLLFLEMGVVTCTVLSVYVCFGDLLRAVCVLFRILCYTSHEYVLL